MRSDLKTRQVPPQRRSQHPFPMAKPPRVDAMPEALVIFMTAAEKRKVVAALRRTASNPARALLRWARRERAHGCLQAAGWRKKSVV